MATATVDSGGGGRRIEDVLRMIDESNDDGTAPESIRQEMATFLKQENAFEVLADFIVSPVGLELDAAFRARRVDHANEDNKESAFDIIRRTKMKRSFRCMTILSNDANRAITIMRQGGDHNSIPANANLFLNSSRVGLLTKKLFLAYRDAVERRRDVNGKDLLPERKQREGGAHIPHVNRLVTILLGAYPSAVVSAASAGGKGAITHNLGPMLELARLAAEESNLLKLTIKEAEEERMIASSTLSAYTCIVITGCTGRASPMVGISPQEHASIMSMSTSMMVSKGHRRKFIHGLLKYGLFVKLVDNTASDYSNTQTFIHDDVALSSAFLGEMVCESLISIVDALGFPSPPPPKRMTTSNPIHDDQESVGEDALLLTLGDSNLIQCLVSDAGKKNSASSTLASRVLLEIFELCMGRSKKRIPPIQDITDENDTGANASKNVKVSIDPTTFKENKLRKSGTASRIHSNLISNIDTLVNGLDLYSSAGARTTDASDRRDLAISIRHPGNYIVERPFTLRRLNLVTLLADILTFEDETSPDGKYLSATTAMEQIMKLPLPTDFATNKSSKGQTPVNSVEEHSEASRSSSLALNPWPALCELLFEYSENNMYQVQFIRLLKAVCEANQEPTLKLILQKCKFVTRAIKAYTGSSSDRRNSSLRGAVSNCLNILRLQQQASSPDFFLSKYLESHDGWKIFTPKLIEVTIQQQRYGGGLSIPRHLGGGLTTKLVSESNSDPAINVDLGSAFAAELGFDSSVVKYNDSELPIPKAKLSQTQPTGKAPKTKNKKNKKKKKK